MPTWGQDHFVTKWISWLCELPVVHDVDSAWGLAWAWASLLFWIICIPLSFAAGRLNQAQHPHGPDEFELAAALDQNAALADAQKIHEGAMFWRQFSFRFGSLGDHRVCRSRSFDSPRLQSIRNESLTHISWGE